MRLESVKICGLFSTFNIEMIFSDEGLTFIHAPNGMGKSTALKMIVDVFSNDAESLVSTPFTSMEIRTSGSDVIGIRKDSDTMECSVNGAVSSLEDISQMMDVIYLSTDRIFVEKDDLILPAQVVYVEEMRPKYLHALSDNRIELCDDVKDTGIGDDQIISQCRDLKARLDFISDVGIKLTIPEGINFPPNRCDITEDRRRYIAFLKAANEWADRYYQFAESISAYKDIVNGFFRDKKLISADDRAFNLVLDNGQLLDPKQISAGEKQIMIIFYRLLFHCKEGSLAIIDEPEISLHISWQQQMGPIFTEISRIRDVQIIVATHSPQIIHDMWDQAAELRLERA